MRYCSNCGIQNDTDAKFCAGCGTMLDGAPAEETATNGTQETVQVAPAPAPAEDYLQPAQPQAPQNHVQQPQYNQAPQGRVQQPPSINSHSISSSTDSSNTDSSSTDSSSTGSNNFQMPDIRRIRKELRFGAGQRKMQDIWYIIFILGLSSIILCWLGAIPYAGIFTGFL